MKKLKYERAEIEVALLDPNMDIILTSPTEGGDKDEWNYNPSNDEFEF